MLVASTAFLSADSKTTGVHLCQSDNCRRYFVWTDSRVRGPFLPVYAAQQQLPWHRLLTQLLRGDTKLAGASISCSGLKIAESQWLQHPHVQVLCMLTWHATNSVCMSLCLHHRSGKCAPHVNCQNTMQCLHLHLGGLGCWKS